MSENAKPAEDQDGASRDDGAPAIGHDDERSDGGPGSHAEDQSGGSVNDAASGGVPEAADEDG